MLLSGIYAFICSAGFAIIFNIPKNRIIQSGITGALGWVVYEQSQVILGTAVFASFLGAFVVGIMGEIFARVYKQPETIFIVPGIVPLVPGYGIYYAMLQAVEQDYATSLQTGIATFLVALAIASAIISTTSIGRMTKRWLKQREVQKNVAESIEE